MSDDKYTSIVIGFNEEGKQVVLEKNESVELDLSTMKAVGWGFEAAMVHRKDGTSEVWVKQ